MAQTACPFCAFSPIDPGAEACPRCRRRFVDDVRDDTSVTATRVGGITGAVTASPVPVAVALALVAAAWFLRGLDVVANVRDPLFLLALPAALVAIAASVMAAVGPAKHLPAAVGVACALAAVVWPTGWPLADGAFVGSGLGLVIATVSEPSALRLKGGAALVGLLALMSVGGLLLEPRARPRDEVAVLEDAALGVRWGLPAGWRRIERLDELLPPQPSAKRAVLLASNGDALAAMAVVDRSGAADVCDEVLAPFPNLVRGTDEAGGPFPAGTRVLEAGPIMAACVSLPKGPVVALVTHTTGPVAVLPATMRVLAGQLIVANPPGP
ncbi:MAG: hypothetical protein MUC96_11850 [Myxococcaceae bacterium]|nr:hypothetical protein [Myxococcaceae bacterium]